MSGLANWGFNDIVDPVTGETRFFEINPNIELYGYLSGALSFFLRDDLWVSLSGYV